jgi:phage-related minor tail protein
VARGKSYLVGERGPELFSPNMSGYVAPSGRGGGGNTQVHIHTPPGMIAETKQDKTANGTRVDVLIREAVRKELPGVMKPMLRDQYGVTPVARKRF